MSTPDPVRELILLMPRLVGRAKKLQPPAELRGLELAPRHRSLLTLLLLDGPATVNDLAAALRVAPTTVSLLVGVLGCFGLLVRWFVVFVRRRRIVDLAPGRRPAVEAWLSPSTRAWRTALAPLTDAERDTVVGVLKAFEAALSDQDGRSGGPRPGLAP